MNHRPKTERVYTPADSMKNFAEKLGKHGNRTAYRYFDRKSNLLSMTYRNLAARIKAVAAGLTAAGLAGCRIAVIGETSVDWVVTYVAAISTGGVAIPLDKELDVAELEGFLTFAEADAIVYSHLFNAKFADLALRHPSVKYQIPMDPGRKYAKGEHILPFSTLIEMGEDAIEEGYTYPERDIESVAAMLFTSGTTGSSKCVMLSEKNIISAMNAACETVEFSADDRIVSVLPIHHTYELCIMLAGLNYGMNIAINDSLKHVLRNLELFQPTGLVLVPLFVSTMNKRVWEVAKKGGKDGLLRTLTKLSHALREVNFDFRRTMFKQVLSAFGGSLEKIVCGGAPLNPELADTFTEFGIDVYEGYGITECSPLIAVNPYFAPKRGSVGPAVPCCEVRIDTDHKNDKGYYEGEIQVKGDNVMMGYYKNEEGTRAVFTDDGWFCTGDVGYMDSDGYIFITGRKKFVIVLENGKNVFPEEIEEYLGRLDSIEECVVLGRQEEGKSEIVLTAVVYPHLESSNYNKEEVEAKVKADIAKMNRKLVGYKQVRGIEFRYEPFEKTTSRKIKRHKVQ